MAKLGLKNFTVYFLVLVIKNILIRLLQKSLVRFAKFRKELFYNKLSKEHLAFDNQYNFVVMSANESSV